MCTKVSHPPLPTHHRANLMTGRERALQQQQLQQNLEQQRHRLALENALKRSRLADIRASGVAVNRGGIAKSVELTEKILTRDPDEKNKGMANTIGEQMGSDGMPIPRSGSGRLMARTTSGRMMEVKENALFDRQGSRCGVCCVCVCVCVSCGGAVKCAGSAFCARENGQVRRSKQDLTHLSLLSSISHAGPWTSNGTYTIT